MRRVQHQTSLAIGASLILALSAVLAPVSAARAAGDASGLVYAEDTGPRCLSRGDWTPYAPLLDRSFGHGGPARASAVDVHQSTAITADAKGLRIDLSLPKSFETSGRALHVWFGDADAVEEHARVREALEDRLDFVHKDLANGCAFDGDRRESDIQKLLDERDHSVLWHVVIPWGKAGDATWTPGASTKDATTWTAQVAWQAKFDAASPVLRKIIYFASIDDDTARDTVTLDPSWRSSVATLDAPVRLPVSSTLADLFVHTTGTQSLLRPGLFGWVSAATTPFQPFSGYTSRDMTCLAEDTAPDHRWQSRSSIEFRFPGQADGLGLFALGAGTDDHWNIVSPGDRGQPLTYDREETIEEVCRVFGARGAKRDDYVVAARQALSECDACGGKVKHVTKLFWLTVEGKKLTSESKTLSDIDGGLMTHPEFESEWRDDKGNAFHFDRAAPERRFIPGELHPAKKAR